MMMKQSTKINFPLLVTTFILVGLLADCIPHPALGSGLISTAVNQVFQQR